MGDCFECALRGDKCPNNIYSPKDIRNSYRRCSPNTEFCHTSDKFQPIQIDIKPKFNKKRNIFKTEDDILLDKLPFIEKYTPKPPNRHKDDKYEEVS